MFHIKQIQNLLNETIISKLVSKFWYIFFSTNLIKYIKNTFLKVGYIRLRKANSKNVFTKVINIIKIKTYF